MKKHSDKPVRLLLNLLLYAVRLTPLWALRLMASAGSRVRLHARSREKAWFQDNLAHIFSLPPHSLFAKMFMRQVFYHEIVSVLETVKCIYRPDLARWEGLHAFQKKVQQFESQNKEGEGKRGQILITGHVGCWELVGYWAAQFSRESFYALAKPARHHALTAALDSLRSKMGIRVLWTGQKTIQRQMLKVLASGGWLGFVMDQKPVGRMGPEVDFFGHKTEFVGGPAQMAVRSSLPVVAVFCLRLGPMHYRLLCREIVPAGHQIKDRDQMTRLMAGEIEKVIQAYPEQWCWNYKRWKFPPKESGRDQAGG